MGEGFFLRNRFSPIRFTATSFWHGAIDRGFETRYSRGNLSPGNQFSGMQRKELRAIAREKIGKKKENRKKVKFFSSICLNDKS